MKIASDMDLQRLAELMGEVDYREETVATMRDLLVTDAPEYGWKTTSDVEDTDWFRLLEEATGSAE